MTAKKRSRMSEATGCPLTHKGREAGAMSHLAMVKTILDSSWGFEGEQASVQECDPW
jgi:hypothetical protein